MAGGGLPTSTAENPNATGGMGGGNADQSTRSLTPTPYNTNPIGVNYEAIFNPNATRPVFDEESYLTQKAQQLQNTGYQGPYTGTTNAELRDYITNTAGMSLQDHYNRYGRGEGLNPYLTGKTERVPLTFAQPVMAPQQQAGYLTDLANQYSQRTRAATTAANQQRVATANTQWDAYLRDKAAREAQTKIDEAVAAKEAEWSRMYSGNSNNVPFMSGGDFAAGGGGGEKEGGIIRRKAGGPVGLRSIRGK